MRLYPYFLITFLGSTLICFTAEMYDPTIRFKAISRIDILSHYIDMLPMVILNLFVAYFYFGYVESLVDQTNANALTLVGDMALWIISTDILFYTVHRAFHHPKLYWLHARHHKYNHTHGMGAIYASVPDFLCANMIPSTLPILAFSIPYSHTCIIITLATGYTVIVSHSGFKPFEAHLLHHLQYKTNYGLLLTDKYLGTKALSL